MKGGGGGRGGGRGEGHFKVLPTIHIATHLYNIYKKGRLKQLQQVLAVQIFDSCI